MDTRRYPSGAKTLHPVESRYGKISQESFNLLSSDRSSSKKNAALFSAFNNSLSLKFEWRQTSRREHQSQTVTDCLQMSLLQLELEPNNLACSPLLQFTYVPTPWEKKHEAKNTLCSLPNRIVSTAPKLKQTENIQMSLLRFGLILNTIVGFRIQTFSVPRRGNGSQIHLSSKK